jgi:membrane protein YqaA with SNARE-associated domain
MPLSGDAALAALFVSSFVAATVFPGASELVLIGVLRQQPDAFWTAIGIATLGNTLGAITSYWIGRILPNRVRNRAVETLRRYGYWALLFSWLPVVGDAFAVAAGWLRLNAWVALVALAVGKFARYLVLAVASSEIAALL